MIEPGTPVSACQRITVAGWTGTTSTRASLGSRSRAKVCCQPAGVAITAPVCSGSGMMGTTARAMSATAAALRQTGARAGAGGAAGGAVSVADAASAAGRVAGPRARPQARSRENARTTAAAPSASNENRFGRL